MLGHIKYSKSHPRKNNKRKYVRPIKGSQGRGLRGRKVLLNLGLCQGKYPRSKSSIGRNDGQMGKRLGKSLSRGVRLFLRLTFLAGEAELCPRIQERDKIPTGGHLPMLESGEQPPDRALARCSTNLVSRKKGLF